MTVATSIGIRELRNGLSRHLANVRDGDEIVVTDHGTPIARITPYRTNHTEDLLQELIASGRARPPCCAEVWLALMR